MRTRDLPPELADGVLPLPEITAAPLCFTIRLPGRWFVQASDHRGDLGIGDSGPAVESPLVSCSW